MAAHHTLRGAVTMTANAVQSYHIALAASVVETGATADNTLNLKGGPRPHGGSGAI